MLAGRGVEADEVEAFLDPTVKRLLPDPHGLTAMRGGGSAHRRCGRCAASRSRSSATTTSTARPSSALLARFLRHCRPRPADPHPRPPVRGLRAEHRGGALARANAARRCSSRVDCGTTSYEPLAEAQRLGLDVVVIDHHHRRRAPAAGARDGQSEPARRPLRPRPSRRGRARVHDPRRGEPRAAPCAASGATARPSPTCSACSIWSRSAPSPTSCRSRASTAPSSPRA